MDDGSRLGRALGFAVSFAIGGAAFGAMLNYATVLAEANLSYETTAGIGAAIGVVLGLSALFDKRDARKRRGPVERPTKPPPTYVAAYEEGPHYYTNGYEPERWFKYSKGERDYIRMTGMEADTYDSNVRDHDPS